MNRMVITPGLILLAFFVVTACTRNTLKSPPQAAEDRIISAKPPPQAAEDRIISASRPEKSYKKGDAAESYYNQGITQSDLSDYKGAIKKYTQAIQLRRDFPEAYFGRGIALSNSGDEKGAIKDYKQAIKIYKNNGTNRNVKDYHDVRLFLADLEMAKLFRTKVP
jgi:tetratricopeptide (TPR) repeat protein